MTDLTWRQPTTDNGPLTTRMYSLLAAGDWSAGRVMTTRGPGGRVIVDEVERAIAAAWDRAVAEAARSGRLLFDGPMCRLESFRADPVGGTLRLALSDTSYRAFVGTNLSNPGSADAHGPGVLADPVGVSVGLVTVDGWLLLGVRNDRVAYYPSRVHPFAGALEPPEAGDVFAAARRELDEELSLTAAEVVDLRCAALVADAAIRQPELVFRARTPLTRATVEARLDPTEHTSIYAVRAARDALARATTDPRLTPVAVATVNEVMRAEG